VKGYSYDRRAAKALNLSHFGLEGLTSGKPVTLFHGSTRLFTSFDMGKSRTELVDRFYGAGIFLVPSKRVAEQYAEANRNMGFDPSLIDDLKKRNAKAGAFMETLYSKGDAAWDDWTPEKLGVAPGGDYIEALQKLAGGVDPNTLSDVCQFIEGTRVRRLGAENEPINIFNTSTGLPAWAYDNLDEIGLDSKTYRPKVYTVTVTVSNPLVTASKSQARGAKSKGYDAVVFYGSDLVGGVPEVAVFKSSDVKIVHVEVV
jgi:hypothetical protein